MEEDFIKKCPLFTCLARGHAGTHNWHLCPSCFPHLRMEALENLTNQQDVNQPRLLNDWEILPAFKTESIQTNDGETLVGRGCGGGGRGIGHWVWFVLGHWDSGCCSSELTKETDMDLPSGGSW